MDKHLVVVDLDSQDEVFKELLQYKYINFKSEGKDNIFIDKDYAFQLMTDFLITMIVSGILSIILYCRFCYLRLMSVNNSIIRPRDKHDNPHQLIWYKQGWSKRKTDRNNDNYWLWEIKHNGLRLP